MKTNEPSAAPLLCCPVCRGALRVCGGALVCPKGHSFDRAASGYVNLLTADRRHAKAPGDSREMVAARRRALESGVYAPFADALAQLALEVTAGAGAPAVLDAGCGEGYYTARVAQAFRQARRPARIAAYDISKEAVKAAARRDKTIEWAVAGSFAIPARDASFHCVLNVFSPMVPHEFARVLRKGGALVYAVPGPRHLYGLKQVLYERPYENETRDVAYEGFRFARRVPVRAQAVLEGALLQDVFAMTPYYWKTPRAGAQRLAATPRLESELAFDFLVYERI